MKVLGMSFYAGDDFQQLSLDNVGNTLLVLVLNYRFYQALWYSLLW